MSGRPELYARWALEMRRSQYFRPGERVGVAVSGGPDSVLLLEFMRRLARETGLGLAVVHFNHRLRGAESDADETFVRALAQEHNLEFIRGEADVGGVALERRQNLEATARELRYRFFFSLISQGRVQKIATAHTANDQAETVLLRLLRGTGSRGLGGVYPVLDGKIIRPLLSLKRAEIEEELRRRKLEFRVDSTNLSPGPRRNKVRMELLPWLEKEFNSEVVALLKAHADSARDDEAYLEHQARESARAWRVREGKEEKIPVRALLGLPPAIARRVLRQMIQGARGSLRGVTRNHIEALLRFFAGAQSGKTLALPGGLAARKDFEWLIIGPRHAAAEKNNYSYLVEVPGEVYVPQLGITFRFKILGPKDRSKAYNREEATGMGLPRLSGRLTLRNWRPGDHFRPQGSRKLRKLKELFHQRKIPTGQRKTWPVLESADEIVWVRGFPRSANSADTLDSGKTLIIEEELRSPQ